MFLYALTILIGAFLLFQVQPVIAKIILPWFGGSAAVWTTCLLFFQLVLLLGYLYSHALVRYLKPRAQTIVHGALLLASALALPIYPSMAWKPAAPNDPIFRILGLLAVTVGLPYFVLSTTGPLLQAWYARRRQGAMPYRLYALSNLGSMFALLSYPVLFEPVLATHQQAMIWSIAYGAFILLCGFTAFRSGAAPSVEPEAETGGAERPAPGLYALWLLLPACASALLLAVTSQLTQNVAAIPLLWVLPLSVYLLSFILCFESAGWYRRTPFLALLAVALACMAYATLGEDAGVLPIVAGIPLFLLGLFACCMVCHGELARLKPHPRYLTHFYLAISAGGAAGGLFVGLAAPLLFNAYYELPIGLVAAAALALTALRAHPDAAWQRHLLPARRYLFALAALAAAGYAAYPWRGSLASPGHAVVRWFLKSWEAPDEFDRWVVVRELLLAAALALALLRGDWKLHWARRGKQWAAFLIELAALLLAAWVGFQTRYVTSETRLMVRNFYGGLRVHDSGPPTDWAATRSLTNGTINHGEQFLNPVLRDSPTTYFGPHSGIALAIRARQKTGPIRVGVIGLGTGTIAAYGRTGDYYRYYEINPGVLRLSLPEPATASTQFTFLADCKARHDVVLGDGRLSLERESLENFDVLAVDAFSSESVPVHLLTREAIELYFRHLKPDGILAVNISNRFVDLEPLVDGQCRALGKTGRRVDNEDDDSQDVFAASWMLATSPASGFDKLILDGSANIQPGRQIRLWTDDYSNLFQILR
jgi:SAM-dependent methyltransferase